MRVVREALMALVGVFLLTQSAWSASFGWNPSPDTNIAGYRLYCGSSSGNYTQSIDVGNTTKTTVSNLTAGNTYFASVTAYNTAALESVKSNEVSFTAVGTPNNIPPTVSLLSPATGASFTAPANITLTATAGDSDGSVSYVEFYNGATRFVTVTSAPYTFAWNNVAAGTYTVTAKAYDNAGASTTSAPATVSVTGAAANQPPTVSLTTNGTSFTPPASVTVTAAASDSDGSISKVEFYNGSSLIATHTTSPYTDTFTGVPAGSYTLTARAYDNAGAVTTSAPVTVNVATTATTNKSPTVSLSSPLSGTSYAAPASIALSATASDSDGSISKVEFYNGTTLLGQSTTSPYTFTCSGVAAGTYTLTARAYDNQGAWTTSTSAQVTVAGAANQPPTVRLTSPVGGTTLKAPATVTLTASASDVGGSVSKVEFYNGTTKLATVTSSPYTVTFTGVPAASYTVTARAYDNLGTSTTSAAVSVTVTP